MKPHPRIRKATKWGGAVLGVVLIGAFVASAWWGLHWGITDRATAMIAFGQIHLHWLPTNSYLVNPLHRGINLVYMDTVGAPIPRIAWGFQWLATPTYGWSLSIPLWIPIFIALVLSALAFRLDTLARRRALQNLCFSCHYDRTGLQPQSPCPECGHQAPTPPS